MLGGDDLINIVHQLLYTRDGAAVIPDLLVDLEAGDLRRLERVARYGIFNTSDVAGYLGVQCREEVPFTTAERFTRADRFDTIWERINLPPGLNSSDLIEVGGAWATFGIADAIEDCAVSWTQPTLILSGEFDPITPPELARALAARLPDAVLASFPRSGQDADQGMCAAGIMTGFIRRADTRIDTGCSRAFPVPYISTTNVAEQDANRVELVESTDPPTTVGSGWTRSVYDTVSYDIVTYETIGSPAMNISLIARPDDLEILEGRALVPMVQSVALD